MTQLKVEMFFIFDGLSRGLSEGYRMAYRHTHTHNKKLNRQRDFSSTMPLSYNSPSATGFTWSRPLFFSPTSFSSLLLCPPSLTLFNRFSFFVSFSPTQFLPLWYRQRRLDERFFVPASLLCFIPYAGLKQLISYFVPACHSLIGLHPKTCSSEYVATNSL